MMGSVFAPLVTPIGEDGRVEVDDVKQLVDYVRPWVDGVVSGIGCGEGWRLDQPAWRTLAETTMSAAGDMPVWLGCQSADWTQLASRLSWAESASPAAVVVAIPTTAKETGEQLVDQMRRVTEKVTRPIVFYWENFISGTRLSAQECAAICDATQAIAVKDSMHLTAESAELRRLRPTVLQFQGWEDLILPSNVPDGYIGPLALLSDSPSSVLTLNTEWERFRSETKRFQVLECDYVARVKSELKARGIISTARLLGELVTS